MYFVQFYTSLTHAQTQCPLITPSHVNRVPEVQLLSPQILFCSFERQFFVVFIRAKKYRRNVHFSLKRSETKRNEARNELCSIAAGVGMNCSEIARLQLSLAPISSAPSYRHAVAAVVAAATASNSTLHYLNDPNISIHSNIDFDLHFHFPPLLPIHFPMRLSHVQKTTERSTNERRL